jgi:hypothetical protein
MIDKISSVMPMYRNDLGYWFSRGLYFEEDRMLKFVKEVRELYPNANIGYFNNQHKGYILRLRFDDEADECEFIMKECQ